MRADTWIRRVAALATVGTLLAVIATVVVAASPSVRLALGVGADAPSFVPGDTLDLPDALRSPAGRTLVIFADATCRVCERGKGLLADVVSSATAVPDLSVRLVTGTAWPDSQQAYVRALSLDDSAWATADLHRMKVRRVPTVVLIDRDGTVIQSWDGLPSSAALIVNGVASHTMAR
jgi:hypothetical protein